MTIDLPKVTMTSVPVIQAPPEWSRELIKQIAMDIGKETVAYVEVMYPKAITATSSTFKLALRNHIYNEIMAAIDVTDGLENRLEKRQRFRRRWVKTYRDLRRHIP